MGFIESSTRRRNRASRMRPTYAAISASMVIALPLPKRTRLRRSIAAGLTVGVRMEDLDESLGKGYGVVLTTVVRIDLEHVCHVQSLDGGTERWDVIGVINGDDRLGVGRSEQPTLLDPVQREGRVETPQVWCKGLEHLRMACPKRPMING